MPYPRDLHRDGEQVVAQLRPHWSYLGWAPWAVLATAVVLVAAVVAWPSAPVAVGGALLLVLVLCGLWLVVRMVRWATTVMVLTTGRVVERTGVIARRGVDVRLDRIHEISYQQTIWQRLLGTGTLFIDVGGDRGVVRFDHVRRPARVASEVHEQIDGRSMPAAGFRHVRSWPSRQPLPALDTDDTPPAGTEAVPMSEAARRLIELDELRRRGVITEAEFSERKARLLDHL
jgi:PH (Pleckstrin Homology) domain-containing protein/putative oligomerization/nucleic acid binding protein